MSNDARPVLTLQDVHLSLNGNTGPVRILEEITLDVEAGETLALVGPSGSGKSSLLMVMGGLEQATGGSGVSELSPDPDDDGVGKCRHTFGTGWRA